MKNSNLNTILTFDFETVVLGCAINYLYINKKPQLKFKFPLIALHKLNTLSHFK